MPSSVDQTMMRLAINFAKQGRMSTRPNPCVGCVITEQDQIIATGWHHRAGELHAERHALNKIDRPLNAATLYLTLEPCAHTGKTSPCIDAVLAANFKRVVIAMADPNPQTNHQSIKRLKQAGTEVDVGLLENEARELNKGFIMRMQKGRPFVRCKMAMSVDGRTAMANGESQWITGKLAREDGQKLRAQSGAIITGVNTIRKDNAKLTLRPEEWILAPLIPISQPLRVIVDSKLTIPLDAHCLTDHPQDTMIVYAITDDKKLAALKKLNVALFYCPNQNGQIDLKALLECLAQQHQINDVLIESGPTLAGAFLQAKLMDELHLYTASMLLGHQALGLFTLPMIQHLNDHIALTSHGTQMLGHDCKTVFRVD